MTSERALAVARRFRVASLRSLAVEFQLRAAETWVSPETVPSLRPAEQETLAAFRADAAYYYHRARQLCYEATKVEEGRA